MTSHDRSQKVSFMNPKVCTTRNPSPPHNSLLTDAIASESMRDFSCFIYSNSCLRSSMSTPMSVVAAAVLASAVVGITLSITRATYMKQMVRNKIFFFFVLYIFLLSGCFVWMTLVSRKFLLMLSKKLSIFFKKNCWFDRPPISINDIQLKSRRQLRFFSCRL